VLLLPSDARGPGHFCLTLHVAMQLGLYLPGRLATTLSGVQSLRILDSYQLEPTHLPVSTAAVHRDGEVEEPAKAGGSAVVTESLLPHDERELLEVRMLRGEQRITFEEGNDTLEQVLALAHHKDERPIASAVGPDRAASESLLDQLEHLSPVAVLADMKLGNELKSDATRRIALHRNRETSFSVYETRDIAIQPFLLIVRTRHVVTIVNVRSDVDDE
jgi:hypothetical protein